jgi:Universal stress protein family
MLKLLVPVNGSRHALDAVRHAAFLCQDRCASDIVLLNVQAPLEGGRASAYHSLEALRQLEEQDGEAALRQARAILDDAGGALRCGQSMRHDRDGFSSAYPPGLFDQSQAVKSADALIAHPGDVGALNADI